MPEGSTFRLSTFWGRLQEGQRYLLDLSFTGLRQLFFTHHGFTAFLGAANRSVLHTWPSVANKIHPPQNRTTKIKTKDTHEFNFLNPLSHNPFRSPLWSFPDFADTSKKSHNRPGGVSCHSKGSSRRNSSRRRSRWPWVPTCRSSKSP